ncbi:DUF1003 domain-containing protein [Microlunatus soli]|uniref:Uncharacterized membrane protein n=1 Tax=Microlunatus soli TaxID=630515 RepID=A0A1H1Q6S8_9ACTN|nr:DUF1003 domain-containing protein [Microlunatus soli]SDS19013.1 Uncharacterized membrane protein [Microlunatus soli]
MARAPRESRRDSERDSERLDTPGRSRQRRLPRMRISGDAFGNFAEAFARFMGTARFLAYMTGFVVLWVLLNFIGLFGLRWDPYPFILLNLFFSTQASYAAPLILLAQNRQEARDRVALDDDRRQAAQTRADMDYLAREIASLRMSVGELATRDYLRAELRTELRAILAELDDPPQQPTPSR